MPNIFSFDWSMPLNEAVAISFIILVFAVCHGSESDLGARHLFLTFKEEVKCDIDEGVRASSLMVSVEIIP